MAKTTQRQLTLLLQVTLVNNQLLRGIKMDVVELQENVTALQVEAEANKVVTEKVLAEVTAAGASLADALVLIGALQEQIITLQASAQPIPQAVVDSLAATKAALDATASFLAAIDAVNPDPLI